MSPYAQVSDMIVDTANQDLDMATDPFLEVFTLCLFIIFLIVVLLVYKCGLVDGFSIFLLDSKYIFIKYDGLHSPKLKAFA